MTGKKIENYIKIWIIELFVCSPSPEFSSDSSYEDSESEANFSSTSEGELDLFQDEDSVVFVKEVKGGVRAVIELE